MVTHTKIFGLMIATLLILTGAPSAYTRYVHDLAAGPSGYALQFDGVDDFVSIPDTGDFDFETAFTVEAWVKPTSLGGGTFKSILGGNFSEPPFSGSGWQLSLDRADHSNWGLCVCTPGCRAAFSGLGGLQTDEWQHLAATYDGSNIKIYRNATLVASKPHSGNVTDVNFVLVGTWVTSFHGLVDEVRIWNIARSQAEIQASMNRSLNGTESGLVGYWEFEEGTGQIVSDSTANDNDGRLGESSTIDSKDPIWVELPPDTVPPAAITDLAANTGISTGQVDLTWTAPGDDGNTGVAKKYIVRYADSPIVSEFGWSMANDVQDEPTPQEAGNSESMTVSGLTPGQTYYFGIKAEDKAGNLSGLSNSPGLVAKEVPEISDFRPNPDGYGFDNPGTGAPRPDCEQFQEIFSGLSIECEDGHPRKYGDLYHETRSAFASGLCLGMSSTSLDYFVGSLSRPREVDTFQLSFSESWPNIAIYHGRQKSKAFMDHTASEWNEWGPDTNTSELVDDVYQQLQAALQPDSSSPVVALFWPKSPYESEMLGHAVTPYRIDDTDPEHPRVYVYENFAAGDDDRYIQFNLSGTSRTFSYGSWSSANHSLVLAPLSIWHSNEADVPYDGWTAAKSGGGELAISDSEGQLIGQVGGVLTTTIPGAMPVFPWYAPGSTPSDQLSYILPHGSYTATVSGATEPYTYTMWTPSNRVLVSAGSSVLQAQATVSASSADQIAVGGTGSEVLLRTSNVASSRPFSFSLMRSQVDVSKVYDIANVRLGTNAMFTSRLAGADELYLSYSGAQESSYDLRLQMLEPDTTTSFCHHHIAIGVGDVHTIMITDWEQLGAVTLQIDQGGDGVVDQIRILPNQCTMTGWTLLGAVPSEGDNAILDIDVDPSDSDRLYAATREGVFHSTDGGSSWSLILPGFFRNLVINPQDSDTIYAAGGTYGVYKSTDGGDEWTHYNEGMTIINIWGFDIAESSPNVLFAGSF